MPRELSPAEERAFARYEALGTPEELQKLQTDNAKLKTENAERRQKVTDLEGELAKAKLPEGAKVLSADEAKAWERYVALGTPDEAEKLKTERDELAGKVATRDRQDAFAKAASLAGFSDDAIPAMLDMKSLDGATWEFKVTKVRDTKSGKDVDVEEPYVTLAGEGQQAQKFSEFAAASPQLKGLPKAGANGTAPPLGITTPEQRGGGGEPPKPADSLAAAKARIAERAKAPNAITQRVPAPTT